MRSRRSALRGVALATVLGLALVLGLEPVLGCTVCYGGASEAPVIRGAEMSVIFLGGLVYLLIGGGALTFFLYRRRLGRGDDGTGREADSGGSSIEGI